MNNLKKMNHLKQMNPLKQVKKYMLFSLGVYVSSFGVCFITKAGLGTSPISSIPYVLSLGFKPTLGQFTIGFNILLICLQIVMGDKAIKRHHILQIPVAMIFGLLIDLAMQWFYWLAPIQYDAKLATLFLGCFVLGLGVFLEVKGDVIMLPGESFVKVLSVRTNQKFGTAKIVSDTAMALMAILLSLMVFHSVKGVREGTLIAAFSVGFIGKGLNKLSLSIMARRQADKNGAEKPLEVLIRDRSS